VERFQAAVTVFNTNILRHIRENAGIALWRACVRILFLHVVTKVTGELPSNDEVTSVNISRILMIYLELLNALNNFIIFNSS
jgi:hypothetical protein